MFMKITWNLTEKLALHREWASCQTWTTAAQAKHPNKKTFAYNHQQQQKCQETP